MSKIATGEKLQHWRGRIVCWATHPEVRNYDGRARSRVLHLVRIGQKYAYPATMCGMAVVEYVTVPKSHDNSTYDGRQLCSPCQKQLDSDKIGDYSPTPNKWGGKTAEEWSRERDRLALKCRDLERECRDMAIDLGAARAHAAEWKRKAENPPGIIARFLSRGGGGE